MGIDKLDSAQDGIVWLAERTYVYPENGRNVHLTIRLSEPMRALAGGGFECAVSIADGSDLGAATIPRSRRYGIVDVSDSIYQLAHCI